MIIKFNRLYLASLRVGDKFETWNQFEEKLKEWRDSTFQPMFVHSSNRLIEKYNLNHPNCELLSEKFKYFEHIMHS